MPSQRPDSAGRRGPIARKPVLAPTGFRLDERTRFELLVAQAFTGTSTLQAVLELAVAQFLEEMHREPGFAEALVAAEAAQRRRHSVPTLPTTD